MNKRAAGTRSNRPSRFQIICDKITAMKYFAFGSNLDPVRMKQRGVAFTSRQKALLGDYELAFNKMNHQRPGSAFANIMPKPGGVVEGLLYEIDEQGLKNLDKYEGVPKHYTRKEVTLWLPETNEKVRAVTYIAQKKMVQKGLKPTKIYLSHLLAGKKFLSAGYFARLNNQPTVD